MSLPPGPRTSGSGVEHGADLCFAVAGALDRVGVEAERDIVDEYPTVDLGEVHPALTAINERVKRADDVVAVNAEIECEVIARTGGHARVWQPELGSDRGNDRLRTVPAGHRKAVRTALDRATYEHLKVVAGLQLDRLDATLSSLLGERKALRFPATGARIEEEHRLSRRSGAWQIHVNGDSGTRCRQRHVGGLPRPTDRRAATPRATIRATAATSAMPATISPTTRAIPRRSKPNQAATPASSTQPSRIRPRGNSVIATAIASASVAAPTTSAKTAASRRFTRSRLRPSWSRRLL